MCWTEIGGLNGLNIEWSYKWIFTEHVQCIHKRLGCSKHVCFDILCIYAHMYV